jgi:hypothetical protein
VISLCDRVREVCPEFPGLPAFAQTAAELEARIRFLLHRINDQPTNQEVTRT